MAISPFVLHIDTFLTNLSVMYRNAAFVANLIFPGVPVTRQSDFYAVYDKDNLRPIEDGIAPRALSNEIRMGRSSKQYYCEGHGLRYPIPDEYRGNDDLGTLETDVMTALCDKSFLNREIDCRDAITAGITTTLDLSASSGANQFSNDSADPIKYIDARKLDVAKVTGKKPNTLVLSSPVLSGLRNNALVKARITGAPSLDGSAITLQQLAAVFDVKQVIEAAAVYNTAHEGQDDVLDFVWGKTALLCYVPDHPGPRELSLGYNFMWNYPASPMAGMTGKSQPVGDMIAGAAGFGVRQWYEQGPRSTIIEFLMYYGQEIVCADAGVLLTNAVA